MSNMCPSQAVAEVVMAEITKITVIAAKVMRVLTLFDRKVTLLPAAQALSDEIGAWYSNLPVEARASELSRTPWDGPRACLGYTHLGHLEAIILISRKTISIYKPKAGGHRLAVQSTERSQLALILNDGVVAAQQASQILRFFLSEQAGVRHCWTVM